MTERSAHPRGGLDSATVCVLTPRGVAARGTLGSRGGFRPLVTGGVRRRLVAAGATTAPRGRHRSRPHYYLSQARQSHQALLDHGERHKAEGMNE